ncbi:MAG: triose-phosphate isomerase family protein, partial [Synechococcaceae cyanobacterium]|nr:triose-phosphate isomerase family protein [Synechococcaceae cyanobacterium]
DVNQKMAALLQWGLRPIILLGEESRERDRAQEALAARLPHLFKGCRPEQMASAVVVYEPEWTIGRKDPAPFQHISSTCDFLRRWIGEVYGSHTGEAVRIIYGGSVTPAHSKSILASPHVDGLGAGRKGRDPQAFARIIRSIAQAKGMAG